MCVFPNTLLYARTHEWVKQEKEGVVQVGITDFAQRQLGDVVYIELPKVGRRVKAGDPVAVIESVKAASDIHSPVSGEVVAVNQCPVDTPECVNQAPYAYWLFAVQLDNIHEWDLLYSAEAYQALIG